MSELIKRLTVKNYGCVKNVSVELTPLHAFIGPNDSGKSTLLRALRTLTQYGGGVFDDDTPFKPQFPEVDGFIDIAYPDKLAYRMDSREKGSGETVYMAGTQDRWSEARNGINNVGMLSPRSNVPQIVEIAKRVMPPRFVRLYSDALRAPASLITFGDPVRFLDERGLGLPGIYDVLINQSVETFLGILKNVRKLFPSVELLGLENISSSQKVVAVTLKDKRRIDASGMSEGLLYYLAFSALPSLSPTSVILIEEPENGLHPARIAEVMTILREVSKTTQVILATHSPLVINEMKPEEVSVVIRPFDKGTQVTRIDKTRNFKDRAKVYALGELWLSYADGDYEAPLLEGGPRS